MLASDWTAWLRFHRPLATEAPDSRMVIWSGHGYLVAVAVFGMSLLMELATERAFHDDNYYQREWWPLFTALALAACISCDMRLITARLLPRRNNSASSTSFA